MRIQVCNKWFFKSFINLCSLLSWLDVSRYLWGFNNTIRDVIPKSLVKLLSQRLEWEKIWEEIIFRYQVELLGTLEDKVTMIIGVLSLCFFLNWKHDFVDIESSFLSNNFAIPYPTYFHPCKDNEVFKWQKRIRRTVRPCSFLLELLDRVLIFL